jgi:hypothetical protein
MENSDYNKIEKPLGLCSLKTTRLKPWSDEEDIAKTGRIFQTLIPRAKNEPTMYSVDCLSELILNVLSEQENTKYPRR